MVYLSCLTHRCQSSCHNKPISMRPNGSSCPDNPHILLEANHTCVTNDEVHGHHYLASTWWWGPGITSPHPPRMSCVLGLRVHCVPVYLCVMPTHSFLRERETRLRHMIAAKSGSGFSPSLLLSFLFSVIFWPAWNVKNWLRGSLWRRSKFFWTKKAEIRQGNV